jgi:hypothetical protein
MNQENWTTAMQKLEKIGERLQQLPQLPPEQP